MTPHYSDPLATLYLGDCLEVMPTLDADSVDAIVTDPPYGIEFMGKKWDSAKPAGFDKRTRDNAGAVTGAYARLLDRGPVQYIAGHPFQAWCEQWGRESLRVTKPGGYLLAFGGTRTHHRLVCALEDAGWIIRDELDWIYASGFPKGKANLKPAHEPIVLARKPGPLRPLGIDECRIPGGEPYVYPNGPGGNTFTVGAGPDGSRTEPVESNPAGRWPSNVLLSSPELFDEPNTYVVGSGAVTASGAAGVKGSSGFAQGYDGEYEVPYGDAGGYSRFFRIPPVGDGDGRLPDPMDEAFERGRLRGYALRLQEEAIEREGGAPYPTAYIVPKADRTERDRGLTERSSHPTVKPIDLMRHLVRLVTPVDGVVLDPFLGSGTTALAASEEGFRCIGIESELEYLEIAKGRLMATPMGLGLDVPVVQPARKLDPRVVAGKGPSRPEGASVSSWFTTGHTTDEEPAA